MTRFMLCGLLTLGLGASARAGELDREAKGGPAPVAVAAATGDPAAPSGSELDKESPEGAWRYRGGWGGYRGFHGYRGGWGGYGFRPAFGGFYGGYRPFYSYGYAYRPFGYSYAYSYYPAYGCYW